MSTEASGEAIVPARRPPADLSGPTVAPCPSPPPVAGRLAVVDDEPDLLATLCEALRDEGIEVAGFADPAAALAAVRGGGFDLILTDLMMPGMSGIELLRRALEANPTLTGVVMTGQGSIPTAVEAMRAGAADFVLKPFRLRQVLGVLDRAREARRARAEAARLRREAERLDAERVRRLEEANARLAAEAATDPLTGLANRRAFDAALAREAALAGRGGRPPAILVLDVDHFKGFNDAFGHPAGDEVLRRVADVVRSCCRAADVPARLGGEEFGVLLPGTDLGGALAFAERVRAAVEAGPWPLRPVTASIGVAALGHGAAGSADLVGAADRALYQAKQHGRNRVTAAGAEVRSGEASGGR